MESILSTLPTFVPDAKAVEAARVAIVKATEATESAYGRWTKAAEAVKAAWPTEAQADRPLIRQWIASGLSKAEQDILSAEADTVDAKARKAAQDKVSQYLKRTLERAYPAPVVVPAAPVLTPEQVEAEAAAKAAHAAKVEWVQAANVTGTLKAEAAVKNAEAKAEAAKVKQAEAAAKLDPTKAAEAEAAKVKAEAKAAEAEAAKAEAEKAEAESKAKAEAAKAAQAASEAICAQIQLEKKIRSVLADAEALLLKAGGLEGAEGLTDFMTAMRNAVATFKGLNA